ncbi:MAG: putative signal transduction protein with domain [Streptosporangiaceae bacterium]|jgi:CBS domain-containing protein|nr:putative signal transduction protein with domain [Streptosporangiaceae bacterium]
MRIRDVLRVKGNAVATVRPEATVRELVEALAERNIGALVVSTDGETIAGIVSERDVVRRMRDRGAALLDDRVSDIMTANVRTCGLDDRVEGLRGIMTEHRIRHLPVVKDDRLQGIVSIGDVVKSAIEELETERQHLVGYIQTAQT